MATSGRQADLGGKLIALKRRLEEQKAQRYEFQGELNSLTQQLEQEFGISNIEDAGNHIEKMNRELERMEKSIRKQIQRIEEKMEGAEG